MFCQFVNIMNLLSCGFDFAEWKLIFTLLFHLYNRSVGKGNLKSVWPKLCKIIRTCNIVLVHRNLKKLTYLFIKSNFTVVPMYFYNIISKSVHFSLQLQQQKLLSDTKFKIVSLYIVYKKGLKQYRYTRLWRILCPPMGIGKGEESGCLISGPLNVFDIMIN